MSENHALNLSYAFGYLTPFECMTMQALVRSLPAGATVVNIGAGAGTSGLAIVEAGADPRNVWTIDRQAEGSPFGGLENERIAFEAAKMICPNQIHEDSAAAGVKWNRGPADLIFIDAGHLENEIQADIDAWLPHYKPGGWVLFHDYGRDVWPAVAPVVDRNYHFYQVETRFTVDTLHVWRMAAK